MKKNNQKSDSSRTGAATLRALSMFILITVLSVLPYADSHATVNPNNFTVSVSQSPEYCATASSNAQKTIMAKTDGAATGKPVRSFGVARSTSQAHLWLYTIYDTTGGSNSKSFKGYYAQRTNNNTNWKSYEGTTNETGLFQYGVANDEYGNVIFGQIGKDNTINNFPNNLLPLMRDQSNDASLMGSSTLTIPKTIQVWSSTTYSNRFWPSDLTSQGGCQIIRMSGDIGATTSTSAPAQYQSKVDGGFAWFVPRGYTNKIFRVKIGYAAEEKDFVGYKNAIKIQHSSLSISTSDPYSSAIGFGEGDTNVLVHSFGSHKLYILTYAEPSTLNTTITATSCRQITDSSNKLFAYGNPTALSIQGHNFIVTPYGSLSNSAAPSGICIYEVTGNGSSGYTLTKRLYYTPISGVQDNTAILGDSFSWIRADNLYGILYGLSHGGISGVGGYYSFNISAAAKATTACTYTGTYKQNGTSTPTLRRIITCNPPTGGEALSYTVYNSSNTSLNSGLTKVNANTYIDDNSSRCTSSSTYSYHTTGVYECDGRARTITETTSPAGPDAAAPAIPAPRTNSTPVVSTFNYYDVSKNAKGYLSYTKATSGSAGSFWGDYVTCNSNSSIQLGSLNGGSTTFSEHISSYLAITPRYDISGHNDSAAATSWYYFGSNYVGGSFPSVDSDCPRPTSPSLTNSLQTSASEVTQMNMPFSWTHAASSSKATRVNYEYTVKNASGTVVASGNTTGNTLTVPDVVVGQQYTAEVRTNYNYNGSSSGGYYSGVSSYTFTPDYAVQDPQIDVNIYKNNAGTVAVWDTEQGWINTTTPIYRIEVDINEPAGTHLPVSYYRLKVNKNDGNGFVYLSNEELRYFPAGSGNITPAQIASKTTVDATGESRTLYFYWDAYNRSHFPDDKETNTLSTKAIRPRTIYPTPETNTPENWVFSLEAVYGADNANVTKSATVDDFQENPTVTSVEGIFGTADSPASVVYYDLKGIRHSHVPESGAYIKVSLFRDGTVRTEKLVAR